MFRAMHRIEGKIKIDCLSQVSEKIFINEQIDPIAESFFYCCDCNAANRFDIIPYETGFPFVELYKNENVLSEKMILENRIASKTSSWASYLGDYTVNNLPTLYFGVYCKHCSAIHLLVFGYGEKQPGLTICEISGVWKIDLIDGGNVTAV